MLVLKVNIYIYILLTFIETSSFNAPDLHTNNTLKMKYMKK